MLDKKAQYACRSEHTQVHHLSGDDVGMKCVWMLKGVTLDGL